MLNRRLRKCYTPVLIVRFCHFQIVKICHAQNSLVPSRRGGRWQTAAACVKHCVKQKLPAARTFFQPSRVRVLGKKTVIPVVTVLSSAPRVRVLGSLKFKSALRADISPTRARAWLLKMTLRVLGVISPAPARGGRILRVLRILLRISPARGGRCVITSKNAISKRRLCRRKSTVESNQKVGCS